MTQRRLTYPMPARFPSPEEGATGSGAVSPSGRALIGSPGARTSRGGSDGGFAPDNVSDRGADAAHVVSVRREISRVKQEHQASIVEMAARHQVRAFACAGNSRTTARAWCASVPVGVGGAHCSRIEHR